MSNEHGVDERTSTESTLRPDGRFWAASKELAGLRRTLGAYAAGFEPGRVTPFEAAVVADEAAKIESIAAVVRDLAASRAGGRAADVERVGG
ncbi:MAG: hypothetical protein J2O39_05240 [Acidimicrobiales bacterium]|nr:hypothetical protein [Acidimicrobiales bacterium]